MVTNAEIERILRTSKTAAKACERLLKSALKAGGKDNVAISIGLIPRKSQPWWRRWLAARAG
jgi:serine/threonine protein phosphatase PrpC